VSRLSSPANAPDDVIPRTTAAADAVPIKSFKLDIIFFLHVTSIFDYWTALIFGPLDLQVLELIAIKYDNYNKSSSILDDTGRENQTNSPAAARQRPDADDNDNCLNNPPSMPSL